MPISADYHKPIKHMTELERIQQKIQAKIEDLAKEVNERGIALFAVSPAFIYKWDADEYNFRHEIEEAMLQRGFSSSWDFGTGGCIKYTFKFKFNFK